MENIIVNQAGIGFLGWLIVFLIIGIVPVIFKKGKEEEKQEKKNDENS